MYSTGRRNKFLTRRGYNVRVSAQKERLERLRREIEELRALVDKPLPLRPAPFVKETAADSAPAAASFKTGARRDYWNPIFYIRQLLA